MYVKLSMFRVLENIMERRTLIQRNKNTRTKTGKEISTNGYK